MCTNPRTLIIRNKDYNSRRPSNVLPSYLNKRLVGSLISSSAKVRFGSVDYAHPLNLGVRESEYEYSCRMVTVPCGKCVECLKTRQNDLACRCVRQAQISGSMQFLTLTYDDDHLPLAMSLERVDKSTGECDIVEKMKLITRQELPVVDDVVYGDAIADLIAKDKYKVRYFYRTIYEDDEQLYQVVITPSLNPRDVRLWLKSARVRYQREYGIKLPEFKYVICGEMGASTHRPHYHLCFFGLSNHDVRWLSSYWKYGFTYLKTVKAVNNDGTSGFEIAARYISKYMTKGDMECSSVKCGYAYKSRLMSSKGLGGNLDSHLVDYFRCYDLFGRYDLNKPLPVNVVPKLVSELKKRCTFNIGGKDFRLSNRFIKQIWYVKTSQNTYRASVVRRQVSDFIQSIASIDYFSKFVKDYPWLSEREVTSLVMQQRRLDEARFSLKNERGKAAFKAFYYNSKF